MPMFVLLIGRGKFVELAAWNDDLLAVFFSLCLFQRSLISLFLFHTFVVHSITLCNAHSSVVHIVLLMDCYL